MPVCFEVALQPTYPLQRDTSANEVAELRSGLCQNLPIQSISLTADPEFC